MRNLTLLSLLTGAAFLAVPAVASAENFSLHEQLGLATNLNEPQDALYTVGPSLETKVLFNLSRNWTLGPTLGAMYFPRWTDSGLNAGLLWTGGATLRLQGDREANVQQGNYNYHTGTTSEARDGGWSPWVDVSALAANTGNLFRPAFSVGAGVDMALDESHTAWAGPFLSFTHVFQTAGTEGTTQLNKNDVNIFVAGLGLSFDFPPRRQVETRTRTLRVVEFVPVKTVCPACAAPPPPVQLEFVETVYFDWDKSVLRWESQDKLDRVVETLKKHADCTITDQGNASLDGQYEHNVALSARRSTSVRDYLIAHGVDASRLNEVHFGPNVPANKGDNKTQEGRERNRRVQFEVHFTLNGSK